MEDETVLENSYKVKTQAFEGPFGVLLEMIKNRKLFINDVSLATVTEDYIAYVNGVGGLNPAQASSFIIVASTLLLIKSKSLLPNLDLTPGEEGDISTLEDRLKLYEFYTNLAVEVKKQFGKKIIFGAEDRKHNFVTFLPDKRITKESMMTLVSDTLGRLPKKVTLQEVPIAKVISIEEMIDKLTDRIQNTLNMNFREFSHHGGQAGPPQTKEEKVYVIVSFLAVLELARQGVLNLIQDNNFDEIVIEKQEMIIEENN